jgi:hypothetical protein
MSLRRGTSNAERAPPNPPLYHARPTKKGGWPVASGGQSRPRQRGHFGRSQRGELSGRIREPSVGPARPSASPKGELQAAPTLVHTRLPNWHFGELERVGSTLTASLQLATCLRSPRVSAPAGTEPPSVVKPNNQPARLSCARSSRRPAGDPAWSRWGSVTCAKIAGASSGNPYDRSRIDNRWFVHENCQR